MALVQFRGLASQGIIKDPAPYELGLTAWSGGMNVRFHANTAERSPAMKTWMVPSKSPWFSFSYRPASVGNAVFYVAADGSIMRAFASGDAVVTNTPDPPYSLENAFTAASMGDVLYLNNPSGTPLFWGPNSTDFTPLPGWDKSWSCRSLRTFGDYVVAMNVVKGAATVPQMFKWSDLTLAGQPPGSWDADDQTTNAGENVLEGLSSPIVDGCQMRDSFIVYASDQAIEVQQVSGQEVFTFTRLGIDGGLIAPNCVQEVSGLHYCFGTSDIYRHDGLQQVSMADTLVRDYIFDTLNRKRAEACFTLYSPYHKEVLFAYNTTDPSAAFQGSGCNRGAVYSLTSNTWSFIDLPNVASGEIVSLDQGVRYADYDSSGPSYASDTDTYYDLSGARDDNVLLLSRSLPGSLSKDRLVAYDFANKGTLPNLPIEVECNPPAYLERIGLDLDTQGSDLTTYKTIRRIYPQTIMFQNTPVEITVGGTNTPSGAQTWGQPMTFDPSVQYKLDMRMGGRYLSYRFTVTVPVDFEVSGFDCDVVSAGRR